MKTKAREALEAAYSLLSNIDFDEDSDLDDMAAPVVQKIGQALAEPIRNCDVGTIDEQTNRFAEFCLSQRCNDCPLKVADMIGECGIRWAQIPYEKEEK